MAFRERGAGEFMDGEVSFEMRAQHLLGPEPLPRFQSSLRFGGELRRAAMRLQSVTAKDHPDVVKRKPVERFP